MKGETNMSKNTTRKDDKGRVVRVYVSTRALRTMAKNGSIERA